MTLEQAQTLLDSYIAAEAAVLSGQSYSIAGRSLTRANLSEIIRGRKEMEAKVAKLTRGGVRVRLGVPGE